MRTKEMPDWMMHYVAATDNLMCYEEFRNLSSDYYNEISDYHQNIYPQQNMHYWSGNKAWGRGHKDLDPASRLHSIDEKYKEKSLEIACKYGYEKPLDIKTINDQDLTDKQEKSPTFGRFIRDDDKLPFDASRQDEIAKEAHKIFFDNHPEAKLNLNDNIEKYRMTEKFDIEIEQKGDLADRFMDELYSSKDEKEKSKDIEPEKISHNKKGKSKEER